MRRGAPARRPAAPAAKAKRPNEPQKLAVRAWVRMLSVQKRALAAIRDDLEREMTLPRFDLLANLAKENGQTLAALSRSMFVTAGNLTGLVDRAARDGLVERRADPDDRRAWRVHVTSKGLRAFKEAERSHAAKVKKIFAGLKQTEIATLIHLLDKMKITLPDAEAPAVPVRRAPPSAPRRGRSRL